MPAQGAAAGEWGADVLAAGAPALDGPAPGTSRACPSSGGENSPEAESHARSRTAGARRALVCGCAAATTWVRGAYRRHAEAVRRTRGPVAGTRTRRGPDRRGVRRDAPGGAGRRGAHPRGRAICSPRAPGAAAGAHGPAGAHRRGFAVSRAGRADGGGVGRIALDPARRGGEHEAGAARRGRTFRRCPSGGSVLWHRSAACGRRASPSTARLVHRQHVPRRGRGVLVRHLRRPRGLRGEDREVLDELLRRAVASSRPPPGAPW